jgi:hypothetical protein
MAYTLPTLIKLHGFYILLGKKNNKEGSACGFADQLGHNNTTIASVRENLFGGETVPLPFFVWTVTGDFRIFESSFN